jgi:hypothetical protein
MSKRESFRDLFQDLNAHGLLEYGSTIDISLVRESLGITIPETASKAVYDDLALRELAAIDYVRNILLGEGKYLTSCKSGYRVLLPSENKAQVDLYIASADRKLNRALKLSRNTPAGVFTDQDQTQARIAMKRNVRKY